MVIRRAQGGHLDVDGVLVASPHERAWREALAEIATIALGIRGRGTFAPERFTSASTRSTSPVKARMSGARAVLDYFRVPEADQRAAEYARHKQRRLELLLEAGDSSPSRMPSASSRASRARFRLAPPRPRRTPNRFMERIRLDLFARDEGRPTAMPVPARRSSSSSARTSAERAPRREARSRDIPARRPRARRRAVELRGDRGRARRHRAAKAGGMAAIGGRAPRRRGPPRGGGRGPRRHLTHAVALDPLVTAGRVERAHGGIGAPDPLGASDRRRDGAARRRALGAPPGGLLAAQRDGHRDRASRSATASLASAARARPAGVRCGCRSCTTLSWASWPRTFVAGLFDTPNTEPPVPALAPAPDWLRIRMMPRGRAPPPPLRRDARALPDARHAARRDGHRMAPTPIRRGASCDSARCAWSRWRTARSACSSCSCGSIPCRPR